ncbi:MAG: P-II family nitrogen regulator [Chitinophagales bacterium]
MKKIEAIIRSSKFEDVKKALSDINVNFFSFMEVKGFGRQKHEQVMYRGSVYDVGYIARMQLEIFAVDDKAGEIVNAICRAAKTGEVGDGKVIVTDIERIVRIRTNETGSDAL